MILSILIAGVAVGSIYAMIGICYNVMYSTSKVLSFTSGQLGMLGAVFGAWLIGDLQWPIWIGFPAAMLVGIVFSMITEFIAVRPVLKNLDQHLYVLSTLALALMVQTAAAIWWGTEPRPFPTLVGLSPAGLAEKYWLPVLVCVLTMVSVDLFYRKTLWGRAFTAISEDADAALALGIPERRMRVISYVLAGFVGALAGFAGGQLLFAFFAIGALLTFYGFIPIAIGGIGSNRGALVGGLTVGILQQIANYVVGGVFVGVVTFALFIIVLVLMPQGLFGSTVARRV
ncbi:MAG: branched-chain amino acid transporter permease [Ramlibacter sp.]|jgi:branched-chain amino acid transport system permease protein|nr:branched-chain amino acid transporter permease [Ramlibacter sp.]